MFTFKPAPKDGSNGNGHANGNGNGNGNGHSTGNSWLGLGNGHKNGNGNGNGNSNGHGNGNGHGHSNKIESVLGPGIQFQGTLSGAGGIRIEGTFEGTIAIKGPLVVADGAKVTANVQASAVTVGGSIKGNITANKVEIKATGRVWGDLVTTAFATEEGAFLRGQVRMEDEVPAAAPALVPEAKIEARAETKHEARPETRIDTRREAASI
jgi:cytoskeletal protein CcmA (bactofilin family)